MGETKIESSIMLLDVASVDNVACCTGSVALETGEFP
jgi:hypothetical protein